MDKVRTTFAARTRDENVKLSEIHVKPLNSPHFSGNIRQYASFKQDFNRLMTKQYGQDPYALRQCLSGEALDTIKGIEDNYSEMFKRLDAKYGEPRKLIDAIVFDIQKLKPVPEGDSRKFINMVDVIERNWLELQRLGMQQEMNNTTMVTMIEKLLPRTQQREWVTKMDNQGNTSKIGDSTFQALLSYLLQEKRVMEYMENDVRQTSNVSRRQVNQTINSAEANSSDQTTTNDATENDMKKIYNQIQNMAERMEDIFKGNTGSNNAGKRGTGVTQMKHIERRACWIHKTDSHPINECNVFLNSNHEEKLRLLRQNGACFNC
ncbi:uncharacterized protein LOC122373955 isoform X4 [Amphibalanus amphitrite]|nr:uncharacterized protein LOC122373955 isoform X4 [Amphibalanus amphitrite]